MPRAALAHAASFIAKLGLVVEETHEAELWLEACLHGNLAPRDGAERLYQEASELRAIFVKSVATAKHRMAGVTMAIAVCVAFLVVSSLAIL